MAESTLSITYAELERAVAHFAGWESDSSTWAPVKTTTFSDILKQGLRRFYYPPTGDGQPVYEWSFLRPKATLALTSGDFDIDLPDDFSGVIIEDSVTIGVGNNRLKKVHAEELRTLVDNEAAANAAPEYYAVRQKTHDPTTGLRYEALFYPKPDSSYTATYRYLIAPDTLTAVNIYAYGGAIHSETLLESVLSCAESKIDDNPQGVHYVRFMECLGISLRLDKTQGSTEPKI